MKIFTDGLDFYCETCTDSSGQDLQPADGKDDRPRHCANCGAFLENRLTDDGVSCVVEHLRLYQEHGEGHPEVLWEWAGWYADEIRERVDLYLTRETNMYDIDLGTDLGQDLLDCAGQGDATEAVEYMLGQYQVVAHPDIADALKEYGAWDQHQLADHGENVRRMVWLLAAEVREGLEG